MQAGLHASVTGLHWIIDSYTLVFAGLLLLAGSTGDRIGRRRMFQTGLVVFAAGSLACSVAPNLGTLIAFRMLQAAGGAMMQPNALSTITNVITDPVKRAHAFGMWAGVLGRGVRPRHRRGPGRHRRMAGHLLGQPARRGGRVRAGRPLRPGERPGLPIPAGPIRPARSCSCSRSAR